MNARLALLPLLLLTAGCPKSQDGAAASSSTTGSGPAASGPLATLSAKDGREEMWKLDQGTLPFLRFDAQRVVLSGSCRTPAGTLDCEALRFLKSGTTVELGPADHAGGMSPGTAVCRKTKHQIMTGTGPTGNEDGFCRFGDGSMVSVGALEIYNLK